MTGPFHLPTFIRYSVYWLAVATGLGAALWLSGGSPWLVLVAPAVSYAMPFGGAFAAFAVAMQTRR